MGVKGLLQFLRKKYPSTIYKIHISAFRNKKIALDTSVFLYNYISNHNSQKKNWIDGFIELIQFLCQHHIQPVFVFDGTPPKEKETTKEKRTEQKQKIKQKIDELQYYIEIINNSINIYDLSNETLQSIQSYIHDEDIYFLPKDMIVKKLQNKYYKLNGQCIHITKKHYQILYDLFDGLGIEYFNAPDEAEKFCAYLAVTNYVYAVSTIDSDILAYGTPIFINNLKVGNEELEIICHQDLLNQMELTHSQFVDFCILCGNDYNTNIRKVGAVKSFDLLKKYKCIENIPLDTSILKYKRSRNLFSLDELFETHPLPKYKFLKKEYNIDKIEKILLTENCYTSKNIIYQIKYKPYVNFV